MAAETDVQARLTGDAALGALVGSRIYAGRAAQNAAAPFVVWRRISAVRQSLLDGPAGWQRGRFQLDCYAVTYSQAVALAAAVEAALMLAPDAAFWAEKASEFDLLEVEEPAMWRRSMDFLTAERDD